MRLPDVLRENGGHVRFVRVIAGILMALGTVLIALLMAPARRSGIERDGGCVKGSHYQDYFQL